MTKILRIVSSPRGEEAYSTQLGNAIVEKLQAKFPDSTVTVNNLASTPYPHLDGHILGAFFTPEDSRSEEQKVAAGRSDEAIAQVMDADYIVIDAPLYNFGIPSGLKSWIDHISRAGITFRYTENGPEGLIKDKTIYIALASGGIYSEGPSQQFDFVAPYLQSVFGFLGVQDITVYRVEGTAVPELQPQALGKAVESIAIA